MRSLVAASTVAGLGGAETPGPFPMSVSSNHATIWPGSSGCALNISVPCPPLAYSRNRFALLPEVASIQVMTDTTSPSSSEAAKRIGSPVALFRCCRPLRSVSPERRTRDLTSGWRSDSWIELLTPQLAPAAPIASTRTPGWARRYAKATSMSPGHFSAVIRTRSWKGMSLNRAPPLSP